MEYVGQLFVAVLEILQLPFDIFGHVFSFWQVFVYTGVAGIVLGFVMEAFLGD